MKKSTTDKSQPPTDGKLTTEQFVLRAIDKLASIDKSTGKPRQTIHTVFSGFNEAFRDYFPGSDPVAEVKKLVAEGKISSRPAVRGAMIARPGVINKNVSSGDALKKMGL